MILFDLAGTEAHPVYQEMAIANGDRHYDFLRSIVLASVATSKPFLSHYLIKALNFHAIACLHTSAGQYRPCDVAVGPYTPPSFYRVHDLMDDFINSANVSMTSTATDPVALSAFVLWRLNVIHPFINGNGRTARACSYYVLCVAAGGWLPGSPILPELITQNRSEYVDALRHADASAASGAFDLTFLHSFLIRLLNQQLAATVPANPSASS